MDIPSFFHHPDISLPVLRRRAGEQLLHLMAVYEDVIAAGGALRIVKDRPNDGAYYTALHRLKKGGLIVAGHSADGWPILRVTPKGEAKLPVECRPETLWREKWNDIWYVLIYDVPERERRYRDVLRTFLKLNRLGCLQLSVWVTPRDIRPVYDDLAQAAGIEMCAYLFEAKTVLGRCAQDIVDGAWDFERLWQIHSWYCEFYQRKLEYIESQDLAPDVLTALADDELAAYLTAMAEDPLLPRQLWPADYLGPEVFALHKQLVGALGARF